MTAPNVDSSEGNDIIYPSAIPFALVHLASPLSQRGHASRRFLAA